MSRYAIFAAMALAPLVHGAPAAEPDYVKDLLEEDLQTTGRDGFFADAGIDGELSREEFEAAARKDAGFVRTYDRWRDALAHDADENGLLNWPEAEAYRLALRARVLGRFDKNGDGKLTGLERDEANAALGQGGRKHPPGGSARPPHASKPPDGTSVDGLIRALGPEFQAIHFTDAQKSQLRVAHETLSKGLDPNDRKARQKLRGALQEKVRSEILSDDQKTDLALYPLLRELHAAALTDPQRAAIRAKYRQLGAGNDKRRAWQAMRDLREQVHKTVLTDEQRTTLGSQRLVWQYGRFRLSPEQKAHIASAYARHTRGVDMLDPNASRAALDKVRHDIETRILSDEQRQALKRTQQRGPQQR